MDYEKEALSEGHLGDSSTCTKDVCESVGSQKRLSRTNAVVSMSPHMHKLKKTKTFEPWQKDVGVRCHHYVARSKEHARLKSERNQNAFIQKQLNSGMYDDDGWFNTVRDPSFVQNNAAPPDVCVAFLSCKRLDKLQRTYKSVQRLIASEPHLRFTTAIVDNGSSEPTKAWIRKQRFHHSLLLDTNVGIAKAMDQLWESCGDARFILNVEDDWVFNEAAPVGVISESVRILGDHSDVLEVWLRTHSDGFQYQPNSKTSKNGQMVRQLPIQFKPLSFYIQQSSKKGFPWWGSFTNGASLKHAARLRSIGNMYQDECGDDGNCESEFASQIAYLGWKVARLCWRNDACGVTSDNEPSSHVAFVHQAGARSLGHQDSKRAQELDYSIKVFMDDFNQ